MLDTFSITLNVTIRPATRDDLRPLEWFGSLTPFRQTIEIAFERAEQGEVVFLVAEANNFPVGQVWVDLVKLANEGVGIIWAFRVLTTMRNLGIGTRLIQNAEQVIAAHGLNIAELGVEHSNPNARRLYERLGYRVVESKLECWNYNTPEGEQHFVEEYEWIMRKQLKGES